MLSTRISIFTEFIRAFLSNAMRVREVIVSLLTLIVLAAFIFAIIEHIGFGDSLYFAFITALSVGYGDIQPTTGIGKILSVAIGLVGMLFIGMTVAIANRALVATVKKHEELFKR